MWSWYLWMWAGNVRDVWKGRGGVIRERWSGSEEGNQTDVERESKGIEGVWVGE